MIIKEEGKSFRMYDENDVMIGEVTYLVYDNIYEINHTFVDPNHRGQKIGDKLIQKVIEKAGKDNKEIVYTCSYAVKKFGNKK